MSQTETAGSPRLAIFHHPACQGHYHPNHPEQPARVEGILSTLRKHYDESYFRLSPRVKEEEILRYHKRQHLNVLRKHMNDVKKAREQQKNLVKSIDSDTEIMWGSEEAIYRAAGSCIAAVDAIFSSSDVDGILSAFCAVRPPGHHAERNKACGFCFLSNAAIAAKHAQAVYNVGKVAVLDFDVHHGNGTEEGFMDDSSLFYGSTHEKDNFPGTGAEPKYIGEEARRDVDRRIVNRYLKSGGSSRQQFRAKWAQVVDEMIRFQPDFVIISAGFDAHDEDPLADVELIEEDFEWATNIIMDACKSLSTPSKPVRAMSVLEGGYDLEALASSALIHVHTMFECSKRQDREVLNRELKKQEDALDNLDIDKNVKFDEDNHKEDEDEKLETLQETVQRVIEESRRSDEDTHILGTLFNDMSVTGDDDNIEESCNVEIADHIFYVATAENEYNCGKKTLFATHIWSGAKILTEKLITNYAEYITGKSVIEFGAAAGLPSLACLSPLGARLVLATDYPSSEVIKNLKGNLDRHFHSNPSSSLSTTSASYHVVEHQWGESVSPLIACNEEKQFDVAIASECLWRHELHEDLVSSIYHSLRSGGRAFITFSHHQAPGNEEKDMNFFQIAESKGLKVSVIDARSGQAMWNPEKESTILFYELIKE